MGKKENVHFSSVMVSLIWKCIRIQPLCNSRAQDHLVTYSKGHLLVVCQHFQKMDRWMDGLQFYVLFNSISIRTKDGG